MQRCWEFIELKEIFQIMGMKMLRCWGLLLILREIWMYFSNVRKSMKIKVRIWTLILSINFKFSRVGCPFEGKKHAPVIFFLNWTLDIQIRCQVYYQLLTFGWETWQRSTVWALLWLNSAFYSLNLPLKA